MQNADPAQGRLKTTPLRWSHIFAGLAVFLVVVTVGHFVLKLQASRLQARQKIELIDFGSTLHERINHELGSVLYLTSGLKSYLMARHNDLQRDEVEKILANLYDTAAHVRNFAIAEGYRVTYIYPIKGNEQALGLNYPDLPSQWPDVKRVVDSGKPFLVGPIDLVQGGKGFVYRVPVIIGGQHWGLLSTVANFDSLMNSVMRETSTKNIAIAMRGRNGLGMKGDVFWGDAALFAQPGIELVDVNVPGGKWVIALWKKSAPPDTFNLWFLRIAWIVLASILGFGTVIIFRQRDQLTQLALYDALTGLPNRHLLEDRINHAISLRRRSHPAVCALLFVDLDGFKSINDRHGHKAGDAVLQGVATRLQRVVRDTDTVGRWGGDEMIVLLENAERRRLHTIVEQARGAAETPTEFAGKQLKVGASIGLAIAPDDGDTLADLIRAADSKMYANKTQRRSAAAA